MKWYSCENHKPNLKVNHNMLMEQQVMQCRVTEQQLI